MFGGVNELMKNIKISLQMVGLVINVLARWLSCEGERGDIMAWLPNYSLASVCGVLSPNRKYNGNFKEFNPLSPGSP